MCSFFWPKVIFTRLQCHFGEYGLQPKMVLHLRAKRVALGYGEKRPSAKEEFSLEPSLTIVATTTVSYDHLSHSPAASPPVSGKEMRDVRRYVATNVRLPRTSRGHPPAPATAHDHRTTRRSRWPRDHRGVWRSYRRAVGAAANGMDQSRGRASRARPSGREGTDTT